MTHYGFHLGIAMALLLFSVREGSTTFDRDARRIASTRWADAIEEIASGAAWGSMDITEPDAGSDMAALRTRAELGADGVWRVTGQKIFITSGHGKYHFVIARTDGAVPRQGMAPGEGLGGLSMFLVKAYDDGPGGRVRHAQIAGVEEKMGHHASATATIVFEDTPAELVGEVGE
ncbi:MAG: acyl-CoA dehydrogenase family protein, partial [Myxococcales bacterium]|nr:acyl-CoA dehydrogenase family protein [Myxococcales bacterium]